MRILLILLLAAAPAMAAEQFSGSTYTITIPDGWVQIPQDVVRERLGEVASKNNLNFAAGLQLASNKTWFTYPYVIIQTIDYPGGQEPTEADIRQIAGQAGGSGSTPELDMTNHRFVTIMRQSVQGIGPVTGQINGHFGRTQAVNINAYARDGEFSTYTPQFEQINGSFQWNSGEDYQGKRATSSRELLGRVGAYGIMAIIVGVVLSVMKKRRTT